MKIWAAALFLLVGIGQAQTSGWAAFTSSDGRKGIRLYAIDSTSLTGMHIRCDTDSPELYIPTKFKIPLDKRISIVRFARYKLDNAEYDDAIIKTSTDETAAFFSSPKASFFAKAFLTAKMFSVVIEHEDRLQSYVFDVTGFGQAARALPCAAELLR
jgi:hypothetical protein